MRQLFISGLFILQDFTPREGKDTEPLGPEICYNITTGKISRRPWIPVWKRPPDGFSTSSPPVIRKSRGCKEPIPHAIIELRPHVRRTMEMKKASSPHRLSFGAKPSAEDEWKKPGRAGHPGVSAATIENDEKRRPLGRTPFLSLLCRSRPRSHLRMPSSFLAMIAR